MIDIKSLLTKHGIEWRGPGKNVSRNHIGLHCCLCGDDPSFHMGVNIYTGQWNCWRNSAHKGSNIYRLLSLLGIPYAESEERNSILQQLIDGTYFNQEVKPMEDGKTYTICKKIPDDFIELSQDLSILAKPYYNYLKHRGFTKVAEIAKHYKMSRCMTFGKWSSRLIIPIFMENEVTWVARAINSYNELRYLTPSPTEARSVKDCLFNFNELKETKGDVLLLCEGVLDSIKIDWYNKPRIRATCIFGLAATETQLDLLNQICPNFNTILIGLDDNTLTQSLTLMRQLSKFTPRIVQPPKKDWADSSVPDISKVLENY